MDLPTVIRRCSLEAPHLRSGYSRQLERKGKWSGASGGPCKRVRSPRGLIRDSNFRIPTPIAMCPLRPYEAQRCLHSTRHPTNDGRADCCESFGEAGKAVNDARQASRAISRLRLACFLLFVDQALHILTPLIHRQIGGLRLRLRCGQLTRINLVLAQSPSAEID
ncbi:hypothetical protein K458DRAFT_142014 [Lentithecium fluviatile CBS 122367]|uniref:Uncharacterized protein n=1 Tax=Lentithecium fluviatile CBS 122367 TaxID=1168545 RepID=A0A6G1IJ53_9PLEO|nr:hypothetical protein K458DRAFT_142014 [Lentithecium fluviatile CBS 122367]